MMLGVGIMASAGNVKQPVRGGLWAWFDASDPTLISLEGGDRVVRWDDRTGNGRHAIQASISPYRPYYGARTIGGRGALEFRGGESINVSSSPSSPANYGDCTFMFVTAVDNTSGSMTIFHHRDGDSANEQFGLAVQASSVSGCRTLCNQGSGTAIDVGAPTTAAAVRGIIKSGSIQQALFNGAKSTTSPADDVSPDSVGHFGVRYQAGTPFIQTLDGLIGEALFYERALSDAELEQNLAYLNAKWGL